MIQRPSRSVTMLFALCLAASCSDDDSNDTDTPSGGSSGSASVSGRGGAGSGGAGGSSSSSSCQSYTEPADGQCGGWYCDLEESQLSAMVESSALCGGDVAILCANTVATEVGRCARKIKSAMPTATNDALRPMIRDCVFENAAVKEKVSADCVDCSINVAACAADNCLLRCLAGNSVDCDTCRLENNCDQPLFSCAGLPNPLP